MLPYVLAWIVGLGSLAIYLAAFFFPEIHRKNDFIWSGVGLFYALVLWIYAGRLTGGLLLGETAGVALLCWFGWQTLALRRQQTPADQQTALPDTSGLQARWVALTGQLQERLSKLPVPQAPAARPPEVPSTAEVLAVAEEVAEIEQELDAAIAKSIAATQEEPDLSPQQATDEVPPTEERPLKEQGVETVEQPTVEDQGIELQAVKPVLPTTLPNPSFDFSKLLTQITQFFKTLGNRVQEIFRGMTQPKPKKPVWTRSSEAPASQAPAAAEPTVVAKERQVGEAPEQVDIPEEITAGPVSETSMPTLTSSLEAEPPAHEDSLTAVPEPRDPAFEGQAKQQGEGSIAAEPTQSAVEEIAPEVELAPPLEQPNVLSPESPQATPPISEDLEDQAIAPTPPRSSSEAMGLEGLDEGP